MRTPSCLDLPPPFAQPSDQAVSSPMDCDILFQAESLDGRRVAVVSHLTHLDGSEEYQVDLYLGDALGSDLTHYTTTFEQAQQLAQDLSSNFTD